MIGVLRVASIALLGTAAALPCTFSCDSIPVCELVSTAEAIVVAKTVELGDPEGDHSIRVRMEVIRRIKDSPHIEDTFEKTITRQGAKVGGEWLIAFLRDRKTGEIEPAGECTDQPLERAGTQLAFLRAWAKGSFAALTSLSVGVGFDGVVVVAESRHGRYESISQDGVAAFHGIPPGVYTVSASAPGFEPMSAEDYQEVDLLENACGGTTLLLETTNRVSGVVRGPEGLPVAGASVSLIKADDDGSPVSSYLRQRTTDFAGRFSFDREDPGRYWLGVNVGSARGTAPYPATYYPDAANFAGAELLEIGPADHVSDLTIRLSRRLQPRSIRVRVLWPDGTPARGARIARLDRWDFDDPREYFAFSQVFEASPADEDGWIEMTAYQSMQYRVRASYVTLALAARLQEGYAGESLPIEIEPGAGPEDLQVTLRRYEQGLCGAKLFLD